MPGLETVGKRIKKILFIVPPNTLPADSLRRISEPLGVLYLGAVLKEAGYEVEVFDAGCEGYDNVEKKGYYVTYGSSEEEMKKRISGSKADIVAVTCMFSARQADALRVCRCVKELDENMPVVIGGIHPAIFFEKLLNSNLIDYVVMGEGEFRLLRLIDELNKGNSSLDFDGIAYKNAGGIVARPAIGHIDINAVPYPDRELIDMEKYIKIGVPFAPYAVEKRVAQVLATRGCPNKCSFCAAAGFWGRKVRARSVENILGELKLLKEKYDIREVQFVDDNLTFNKSMAKELFAEMKGLGLKWCTPNGLMFNTLDRDMIRLMAESGAYQLSFAIESASERVLREIIHKNVRLERIKELVEEAHRYDISVHGMFIVGFPGETRQEILSTLDFPFSIGFDSASFFIISPLPGSEIYQECIGKNYIDDTCMAVDFKTAHINIPENSPDYNFGRKELERLVDKKTKEYNEFAKELFPERWRKKFKRFLDAHQEHRDTIMGRVT